MDKLTAGSAKTRLHARDSRPIERLTTDQSLVSRLNEMDAVDNSDSAKKAAKRLKLQEYRARVIAFTKSIPISKYDSNVAKLLPTDQSLHLRIDELDGVGHSEFVRKAANRLKLQEYRARVLAFTKSIPMSDSYSTLPATNTLLKHNGEVTSTLALCGSGSKDPALNIKQPMIEFRTNDSNSTKIAAAQTLERPTIKFASHDAPASVRLRGSQKMYLLRFKQAKFYFSINAGAVPVSRRSRAKAARSDKRHSNISIHRKFSVSLRKMKGLPLSSPISIKDPLPTAATSVIRVAKTGLIAFLEGDAGSRIQSLPQELQDQILDLTIDPPTYTDIFIDAGVTPWQLQLNHASRARHGKAYYSTNTFIGRMGLSQNLSLNVLRWLFTLHAFNCDEEVDFRILIDWKATAYHTFRGQMMFAKILLQHANYVPQVVGSCIIRVNIPLEEGCEGPIHWVTEAEMETKVAAY